MLSQVYGLLQLLRIKHPTLVPANTQTIRQCRYAAFTEACQPLVGAAQADFCFRFMCLERYAL
jgi:hypothetical protein